MWHNLVIIVRGGKRVVSGYLIDIEALSLWNLQKSREREDLGIQIRTIQINNTGAGNADLKLNDMYLSANFDRVIRLL